MQGYLFGIWCDYFLIIFGLGPEILIFIVFDYLILFLLFMDLIVLAWQALSWAFTGTKGGIIWVVSFTCVTACT